MYVCHEYFKSNHFTISIELMYTLDVKMHPDISCVKSHLPMNPKVTSGIPDIYGHFVDMVHCSRCKGYLTHRVSGKQ